MKPTLTVVRELIEAVRKWWNGLKLRFAHYLLQTIPSAAPSEIPSAKATDLSAELRRKLRNPGIDCPMCNTLITVDIVTLLRATPITCPNSTCRLVLVVNQVKSQDSLAALERFQEAFQKLDRAKDRQ